MRRTAWSPPRCSKALALAVATANDGEQGVIAAEGDQYDLILMDIQMPGIDGIEATRRIRALSGPVAQVPIIALTANVLAHQQQAYLAAGMNGVVGKPISPSAHPPRDRSPCRGRRRADGPDGLTASKDRQACALAPGLTRPHPDRNLRSRNGLRGTDRWCGLQACMRPPPRASAHASMPSGRQTIDHDSLGDQLSMRRWLLWPTP